MNTDFRVSVTLARHPKTIELAARNLGQPTSRDRAIACCVRLWAFTATQRPDGDLTGIEEDVANAVGCSVEALVAVGFLDRTKGRLLVHDWETRNPWACNANERSNHFRELGRKGGKASAAKRAASSVALERSASSVPVEAARRNLRSDPNVSDPDPEDSSQTRNPGESGGAIPPHTPRSAKRRRAAVPHDAYSPGFLQAWVAYPHAGTRSVKPESFRLWKDFGLEDKTEQVLAWIEFASDSEDFLREGGKLVPGFQVWLRGGRAGAGRDFTEPPPNGRIADPRSLMSEKTRRGADAVQVWLDSVRGAKP